MANNSFNMNMEFGQNKDENISSTIMGIAVRNGESWRIYDKKKREITDIGNMQLTSLPLYICPAIKLNEGDLIKDGEEYSFVTRVTTDGTPTQFIYPKTGEVKSTAPIKNILGFSCYLKVIALSDELDIGEGFDMKTLAIMSATGNQSMNQLLPLMLFKDKFDGNDDMKKLMMVSSMTTSAGNEGQMNQLLPLMLFKGDFGGDGSMEKMLLLSSMMGGNTQDSGNLMMTYLMLDALISKKEKHQQSNPDLEEFKAMLERLCPADETTDRTESEEQKYLPGN